MVDVSASRDPIEDYLDQLFRRLRTTPGDGRRILAEAEDHLRQAVADGMAAGMTEREAQEEAISSFGSVRAVVRAHDTRFGRFPIPVVVRDLVLSGWLLGAFGLVAVGASGLVAAVMNTVLGRQFVGGIATAARLRAADCQHWLAVQPTAHTCVQAATLENSADAVSLRLLAGVAGLILLAGYHLARRGRLHSSLPDGFVPVVAASVFGITGIGLAWVSAQDSTIGLIPGPGFYLSGAIVCLAATMACVPPLRRTLLRHAHR